MKMPATEAVRNSHRTKEICEQAIVALVVNLGVSYNAAASILLTEVAKNLTPAAIKKALASK